MIGRLVVFLLISMSVQNETNRVQYWGNGSTTIAYPVPFYFFEAGDLRVVVTNAAGADAELTEESDYSVTGAGNENGGSVLTVSAVPVTSRVTIYREVEAVQTTVYEENGEFPARTHERALDRQTMLNQQNARAFDRALKVRESDGEKGELATVANSVIGFGGDLQPRTFTPSQLAVWLNLTQQVFGEGTKAWLTDADRAMAVPDFLGQVGVQLDNSTVWVSSGSAPGAWTAPIAGIPDNYIITAMLSNGALSADSAGRAKMSDSFLTLSKIGGGIFTADSTGRGKFESGFVDPGLCVSGLWGAIAPVGAVLQTKTTSVTGSSVLTAIIPSDNTIPQNSEGTQIVSQSIAPISSLNKIRVKYSGFFSGYAISAVVVALFRAGNADAIATAYSTIGATDWGVVVSFEYMDSPASLSSLVYSVRGGPVNSNAVVVNAFYSGSRFGGTLLQTLSLEEIKG